MRRKSTARRVGKRTNNGGSAFAPSVQRMEQGGPMGEVERVIKRRWWTVVDGIEPESVNLETWL